MTEPAESSTSARRPHRLRWLTQPSLSPLYVAALGLATAAAMGLLTYLNLPGMPWWWYLAESVDSGFMPVLVISAILFARIAFLRGSDALKDRECRRDQTLAVAVFAARTRYYESIDHPEPMKAATYDLGNYLSGRAPVSSRRSWETAAIAWYSTGAGAQELAPLPRALVSTAAATDSA